MNNVWNRDKKEPQLKFAMVGGYTCRIVPGAWEEELSDYIEDLHYESNWVPTSTMKEDYWTELQEKIQKEQENKKYFYDGSDISSDCLEMLRTQFGSDRYAPSWLLARLWQLTDGGISKAMVSLQQGEPGFADGGDYHLFLLVEKDHEAVAVLCIEGSADLHTFIIDIRQYSESLGEEGLEQIFKNFADTLLRAPKEIAVCKITINDPEQGGFPWEYGWDGKVFLRCSEEAVLSWLDKKGRNAKLIREALNQVEAHPFHHLERSLREAICQEHSRYIRIYEAEKISFIAFRLKMELEVMTRAWGIWQNTWREEDKLCQALTKCRELAGERDANRRRKIIEELENTWNNIRDFMEHTTIRDIKHKTHKFPASLAGHCIMQGAYRINYEMERYGEVIDKWKILCRDRGVPSQEELQRIQKEMEVLVNAQDNQELSEDSWGKTGETDTAEDFYREDMHFYAACTFAGGLPYEMEGFETGQPEKFREYWRWWLLEALNL